MRSSRRLARQRGQTQALQGRQNGAAGRRQGAPQLVHNAGLEGQRRRGAQGVSRFEQRCEAGFVGWQRVFAGTGSARQFVEQIAHFGGDAPQGALVKPAAAAQGFVQENQALAGGERRRQSGRIGRLRPQRESRELRQQHRTTGGACQRRTQLGGHRQRREQDAQRREVADQPVRNALADDRLGERRIEAVAGRQCRSGQNGGKGWAEVQEGAVCAGQRSRSASLSGLPFHASASGKGSRRTAMTGHVLANLALRAMKAR